MSPVGRDWTVPPRTLKVPCRGAEFNHTSMNRDARERRLFFELHGHGGEASTAARLGSIASGLVTVILRAFSAPLPKRVVLNAFARRMRL